MYLNNNIRKKTTFFKIEIWEAKMLLNWFLSLKRKIIIPNRPFPSKLPQACQDLGFANCISMPVWLDSNNERYYLKILGKWKKMEYDYFSANCWNQTHIFVRCQSWVFVQLPCSPESHPLHCCSPESLVNINGSFFYNPYTHWFCEIY